MSNLIFLLDIQKAWYVDLFRVLFAFLDFLVYWVVEILFRAIFNIANFELYGLYEDIMERVFVILGIFMLFKITISLISYLVNPDKISDKEQGVSKVVTRIIIVLVMLIGLPTFFSLMTEAQNKLLPAIPRVIIGTANSLGSEDVTGISENMTLTMIQGFAHLKDGCTGQDLQNRNDFLDHINDVCSDSSNTYKYDYLPVFSTLTGALMCYVLFSLCISVAIRAFKLIILRSIAPIPVISYIDPKSSKDGAFSTWIKTFISTWSELFIHIGLIYFIVYIIDFLLSANAWKGFFDGVSGVDAIILLAFLIIGLLFFAKQAPKFVMDSLGIKSNGNFMRMLGMGATAIGGAGTIASSLAARNKENPGQGFRNFGASLFNGVASTFNAGSSLLSTDKPSLRTGYDEQQKYNSQMLRRIESGSTAKGRLNSMLLGLTTGQTPASKMRNRDKELEKAFSAFKDYKSTVESRFDGDDKYAYQYNGKSINWLLTERLYSAANNGDDAARLKLESYLGLSIEKIRENYDSIHKSGYAAFADDIRNGTYADSTVAGSLLELQNKVDGIIVEEYDSYGKPTGKTVDLSTYDGSYVDGKKNLGNISGTKRKLETSDQFKAAMADEKETKN